jgi:glycosyltransferase involved in cell wall biosynthesis
MKNKNFRMLCLFDYGNGVNTGYATVSRNLVKEWKKYYGENLYLDIVAINYYKEPYLEDERIAVDNAYFSDKTKTENGMNFPTMVNDKIKNDEFGRLKFLQNLKNNDYDLVFILQDLGIVCPMANAIQQIKEEKRKANKKQFKSVFYFPLDCHAFPSITQNLDIFDKLVAYTEFGKREVVNIRPNLGRKTSIIPHGTNINDFFPVEHSKMLQFRKEYFGENHNRFIIGNINRNQPRKDIPATIFGFMRFKEECPEAFLYLHMNAKDPLGYDLPSIFAQTPLKEGIDYMFPPKDEQLSGCDIEKLNLIYNSLNCYITTNRGEGWGLSITEAMRCKIPVIAPLHTSIEEISLDGKNIWAMEEMDLDCTTVDNIIRYKCMDYEIAEKLRNVFHADRRSIESKTNAAYNYVSSITWQSSSRKFIDIFNNLL